VQQLVAALRNPARPVTAVPYHAVRPAVMGSRLGFAIVIDRTSHHLNLFRGDALVRSFPVAVGQSAYPTPAGSFTILDKQLSPWWYPPNSAWAAGEKPVPPGPGNPLGTRWMGLGGGVGIHGTPDAASVGYSASHGCIRMQIPDAEWVFQRVSLGTPVWIL
jgi:lipoprotein-anchoring transpeptidase ErfK/SrfK